MSWLLPDDNALKLDAVARAAGADAGNRSMRAGGRSKWSADDYDAAARTFNEVLWEEVIK